MINFHQFFKRKMTRFFAILFASLLLFANIGLFFFTQNQYNRSIERQENAFIEMMVHLLTLEDPSNALIYVEHYDHTHGVNIAFYTPSGDVLYNSSNLPSNDNMISIIDGDTLLAQVTLDYQSSALNRDTTIGFLSFNILSFGLFMLGLIILFQYINKQNTLVGDDLERIGKRTNHFNFSDIALINEAYIHSIQEVKDLKELQAHYVQALAHDLKTPLTVMRSYLEGIKSNRLSYNETINQELLSEIDIIEQLIPQFISLDLMSLPRKQNIAPIIEELCQELEVRVMQKAMKIETHIEPLVLIVASSDIKRLIEHLVLNAYYYSPEGSIITITLNEEKRQLRVEDQGIGMTPKTIDSILKGPYRAKEAVEHHQKGSGIGYQIVLTILKRMSATMAIDSSPQQGTSVTITF